MADPRFFKCTEEKTLSDLAELAGGELSKNSNPDLLIKDVAPLGSADSNTLSFLDNAKYKDDFKTTQAGACVISSDMAEFAPSGISLILSDQPYKAYALIAQAFYPNDKGAGEVSDKAFIDPSANIGQGCVIKPGVCIEAHVEIGAHTIIGANTVIEQGTVIGQNCNIGANVTISHSLIGDHVTIYRGCSIGQDGFGFAIDPAGHVKVPQLGRVVIESHVEIGANTAIDRGAGPDTIIGQGTWIDNLVQIGHNARIGKGCVIVAQVGISGSSTIEDYVVLAGQVGVAGHITVGRGSRVGAQSGLIKDLPSGSEVLGSPAVPIKQFARQVGILKRMANKGKK